MLFLIAAPVLTLVYFFATALPLPMLAMACAGALLLCLTLSFTGLPSATPHIMPACLSSIALAAVLFWNGWMTTGWPEPGLGRNIASVAFLAAIPGCAFIGALVRKIRYFNDGIPLATWAIGGCVLILVPPVLLGVGDSLRVPVSLEDAAHESRGLIGERQKLLLFGGLIAGGVWSAVGFVLALFSLPLARRKTERFFLVAVMAAGVSGILLTDTRSAMTVAILAVGIFVSRICTSASAALRLACGAVVLSLLLPLAYPVFIDTIEEVGVLDDGVLDRGYGRVVDLSGRLDIWRSCLGADLSLSALLLGEGPYAEYTTGLAKEIQYTPYFSGRLFGDYGQYMHAHSLFLNIMASNGLVGLAIVVWFFISVACLLARTLQPAALPLLMAWTALILVGSTESLLSGLYVNMPIVFFAMSLEGVALNASETPARV